MLLGKIESFEDIIRIEKILANEKLLVKNSYSLDHPFDRKYFDKSK